MAKWTYEATKAGYTNLWRKIAIKGTDAKNTDKFAHKIIAAEERYKKTEAATGVPWFFIGALHMRESGCNFDGVLHNGEHIIGTNRKTRLVPKNRGPFSSWEAAAIDALKLKNLHKVPEWNVARMGFHAELFNGTGYIGRGVNSAYLWAGSNLEQKGKYVADHVWNGDFDDPQIGVMTVLRRLCELRPDINKSLNGGAAINPRVDKVPPKINPEVDTKPATKSGEIWASIGTILTAVLTAVTDYRVLLVLVVALAAFVIYRRFSKDDISGWFK